MAKSFGPAAIAMTAMLAPLIAAQPTKAAAAPPEIVDFLVQDVCLNNNGNIIVGMMTPLMNWARKLEWYSASLREANSRSTSAWRPKTLTT